MSASAMAHPADLVFTGGAVYTVDAARSWAEAVAVRGGRIAAVGTVREVAELVGPRTRVLELEGRMVLPGAAPPGCPRRARPAASGCR